MTNEDNHGQRKYWPFEVPPPEQRSDLHQQEIRFLESALREGYAPYMCAGGNFGAADNERSGLIVVRGRSHWEIVLGSSDAKVASAFVDSFACAAAAVLKWLRGADTADILSCVQDHLALLPGAAHSFVVDAVLKTRSLS
jgi:hypothetical protein